MVVFGSACFQFSAKIILELILHDLHHFQLLQCSYKSPSFDELLSKLFYL